MKPSLPLPPMEEEAWSFRTVGVEGQHLKEGKKCLLLCPSELGDGSGGEWVSGGVGGRRGCNPPTFFAFPSSLSHCAAAFFLLRGCADVCLPPGLHEKKWDGKIEPRLLGTFPSNLSSLSAPNSAGIVGSFGASSLSSGSSKVALVSKLNITNYAFLNKDAGVRVYVKLPRVGNCRNEDVLLEFTEQSLCFTVKNYWSPLSSMNRAEVPDELAKDASAVVLRDAEEGGEGGVGKGEDCCLSFGRLYTEIKMAAYQKRWTGSSSH
jgi:hypothetical protein